MPVPCRPGPRVKTHSRGLCWVVPGLSRGCLAVVLLLSRCCLDVVQLLSRCCLDVVQLLSRCCPAEFPQCCWVFLSQRLVRWSLSSLAQEKSCTPLGALHSMARSMPVVGRLYTVAQMPTDCDVSWWDGDRYNTIDWIQSEDGTVVHYSEVLMGLPTDLEVSCGWWHMRILYDYSFPDRMILRTVWVAPWQVEEININKPMYVWRMPREAHHPTALYSREQRRICEDPSMEDAYILDCRWEVRNPEVSNECSGFCKERVKVYLREPRCVFDVITAALEWNLQGQSCLWAHCRHGKHRSQSALSILQIFTGAFRYGWRPRARGWCDHEEITPEELCIILV